MQGRLRSLPSGGTQASRPEEPRAQPHGDQGCGQPSAGCLQNAPLAARHAARHGPALAGPSAVASGLSFFGRMHFAPRTDSTSGPFSLPLTVYPPTIPAWGACEVQLQAMWRSKRCKCPTFWFPPLSSRETPTAIPTSRLPTGLLNLGIKPWSFHTTSHWACGDLTGDLSAAASEALVWWLVGFSIQLEVG